MASLIHKQSSLDHHKPLIFLLLLTIILNTSFEATLDVPTGITATPTLSIGGNYYTQTNYPMPGLPCLSFSNNDIIFTNPESSLGFSESMTFSEVEKTLNVDMGANIGWGLFSAGLSFDYLHQQIQEAYSLNLNFAYQYTATASLSLDSNKTGVNLLSATGAEHFNNGPQDFSQNCADSFVQEATAGITLLVTYSVQFNSQTDKDTFTSKLSVGISLFDITTEIQRVYESTKTSLGISLKALQLGGEPQYLNDIFGTPVSGSFPMMDCVSGTTINFKACEAAVTDIIAYAQTVGNFSTTGIQTQVMIDSSGHVTNPLSFYYTDPLPVNWTQINASPGVYPPVTTLIQAQMELVDWYQEDNSNLIFLQHYIPIIQTYPYNQYTGDQILIPQLQQIVANLTNRLQVYDTYQMQIQECYVSAGFNESCLEYLSIVSQTRTQTYPINETLLSWFNTSLQVMCTPDFSFTCTGAPLIFWPIGVVKLAKMQRIYYALDSPYATPATNKFVPATMDSDGEFYADLCNVPRGGSKCGNAFETLMEDLVREEVNSQVFWTGTIYLNSLAVNGTVTMMEIKTPK